MAENKQTSITEELQKDSGEVTRAPVLEEPEEPKKEPRQLSKPASDNGEQEYHEYEEVGEQPDNREPIFDKDNDADLMISLFDTAQTLGLQRVKRSRMFTPEEWKRVKQLRRNWDDVNETEMEGDELNLYNRYQEYKESVEELPFEDEESERLNKPVKRVMNQANVQMSPGWALVVAMVLVMFPRIIEVFLKDEE